jgi:hypothetical protein
MLSRLFPVLLDVERPLELQMDVVVVIDELGDGGVVATGEHAGRCSLGFDCTSCQRENGIASGIVHTLLLVVRLLFGVRPV